MPRNVTVTFDDGSTHSYQNIPDDVTPEQVTQRAQKDFGKTITAIDGGRGQPQQSASSDVPLTQGMQGYDEQQAAQKAAYANSPANQPRSFIDKAIGLGETALAAGTGATTGTLANMVGAGLGIGKSILNGTYGTQEGVNAAQQQAEQMGANFTYAPRTQAGQEYTQSLGEAAGALDPAMAMGGIGKSAIASPSIAQLGESSIAQGAKNAIANEASLIPTSISDLKSVAQGVSENIAANKGAPIQGKVLSENVQTVNRLLAKDPSRDLATKELKVIDPTLKDAQGNLLPEAYKVVDDPAAKEAIKNGIDDGVVGLIKKSDPYTAQKMKEMTDISERNKSDLEYAVDNRPSQVVGDEILSNYKHVENVNKAAGKAIDNEAKNTLRGNQVDVSEPMDKFMSTLKDDLGVTLEQGADGKLKPVFSGSQLRSSAFKRDRQFIKNIIDDLHNAGEPDAYNVHNFKRAIDNMVVYGDGSSALNKTVENSVKSLRNGLDTVLDNKFEAYNKANQDYSTTIKALGDIRDVAGKKLKFNESGANEQLGVLSRGMLSNIKSRQQLTNAITGLQDTANTYGANSQANIKNMVMYANELDRRFGSHAPTSFAGETQKATASSGAEILGKAGLSAATGGHHGLVSSALDVKNKMFNTTNKDAYNALRKLTVKQYGKKEAAQ